MNISTSNLWTGYKRLHVMLMVSFFLCTCFALFYFMRPRWRCPAQNNVRLTENFTENDWVHVAIVGSYFALKELDVFSAPVKSLLWHRRVPVHLHILGSENIVHQIRACNHLFFRISHHDINTESLYDLGHYNANKYKLLVEKSLLHTDVKKVIVIDTDLAFFDDVGELYKQFNHFKPEQAIGLAPEYFNQYADDKRHISHGGQNCVKAIHYDGHDGFNTGVALLDLEKLRKLNWWMDMVVPASKEVHSCLQPMGDQDIMNHMLYSNKDLLYVLPYEWHMQYYCFNPTHFSGRSDVKCKKDMWKGKVKIGHWNGSAPYAKYLFYFYKNLETSSLDQPFINHLYMKAHDVDIETDINELEGFWM
ncbi:hypothetical protein AKO1_006796 [Acrasis kona]|uniref:Glycosyltransferase n=1 Tax=Acrasis kona TaxID=1008807 RepID=A0AAW2YT77_9EUKA